MAEIELHQVSKSFSRGTHAVRRVSLEIADGEFLVLVGPSGCGKSTLLRMIAGIEEVSDGQILIDGRDATHLPPRERDIGMVFQNYALYPHMTVQQNLGFGLKLRRMAKPEIDRRVMDVMRMLRLVDLKTRKPGQLSGGQRQRVAMGRAIVREPAAFLMDEPLSNLDAKLRVAMRAELSRLHDRLGVTTVYVTHDQVEAMTLGQRVAVLNDGALQQVDTPQRLFHHPANLFVAAFIGSPAINLAEAGLDSDVVHFGGHSLPLPHGAALPDHERLIVGIRPTDFELADRARPGLPRLAATVEVVEDLGSEMHIVFGVEVPPINVESMGSGGASWDDRLLAEEGRTLFVAKVASSRRVVVGERLELAVDNARLHFFDPRTGLTVAARQPALA